MRVISVLVAGAALASCTGVPQAPTRDMRSQAEYQRLVEGKVAQAPESCIPHYNADDMVRIDENTVVFRQGSSRVYVAHMQGRCSGLTNSGYALVTRDFGGSGLCRG